MADRVCKYCGESKPTEGFRGAGGRQCKDCRAEYNKIRYRSDKAKIKERMRLYGEKHREQLAERTRVWYRENKVRASRRAAKYYINNRVSLLQYSKQWSRDNREKANKAKRLWALANPEKYNAGNRLKRHRRRAREQGAGGSFTAEDIIAIRKSQRERCFYCGVKLGDTYNIDHFVPLSKGGTNNPSNLRLSCPKCNFSKGASNPQEFIQREFGRLF